MIIILLLAGCSQSTSDKGENKNTALKDTKGVQTKAANSKPAQIVLAYEKTPFKEALINEIEKRLLKNGVSCDKILHSSSLGFSVPDPAARKAIFISVSGVHSKVRPWIKTWLSEQKQISDRIILHVTQKSDWKVNSSVDTVTSASVMAQKDELASKYADIIFNYIKKSASEDSNKNLKKQPEVK
jgi:hypothetical protein